AWLSRSLAQRFKRDDLSRGSVMQCHSQSPLELPDYPSGRRQIHEGGSLAGNESAEARSTASTEGLPPGCEPRSRSTRLRTSCTRASCNPERPPSISSSMPTAHEQICSFTARSI